VVTEMKTVAWESSTFANTSKGVYQWNPATDALTAPTPVPLNNQSASS
jgi:hypothetical protein